MKVEYEKKVSVALFKAPLTLRRLKSCFEANSKKRKEKGYTAKNFNELMRCEEEKKKKKGISFGSVHMSPVTDIPPAAPF